MQTSMTPEAPITMDFTDPSLDLDDHSLSTAPAQAAPTSSSRTKKRHCGTCGVRTSRRATYCSACGHQVERTEVLGELAPYIIAAAVGLLFIMLLMLWLGHTLN